MVHSQSLVRYLPFTHSEMSADLLPELSPDNESTTLDMLDDPAIAAEQREL